MSAGEERREEKRREEKKEIKERIAEGGRKDRANGRTVVVVFLRYSVANHFHLLAPPSLPQSYSLSFPLPKTRIKSSTKMWDKATSKYIFEDVLEYVEGDCGERIEVEVPENEAEWRKEINIQYSDRSD